MRCSVKLVLLGTASLGRVACVPKEPTLPPVVVLPAPAAPPETSPIAGVLDSVGMLLQKPLEAQHAEVTALTHALDRTGLPSDRLRLALILALASPPVGDDDRARALVEARTWERAGYETLARFVLQLLHERAERAQDQRDASAALDAERMAREDLEKRLEAIKAIETDIGSRDLGTGEPHVESP